MSFTRFRSISCSLFMSATADLRNNYSTLYQLVVSVVPVDLLELSYFIGLGKSQSLNFLPESQHGISLVSICLLQPLSMVGSLSLQLLSPSFSKAMASRGYLTSHRGALTLLLFFEMTLPVLVFWHWR